MAVSTAALLASRQYHDVKLKYAAQNHLRDLSVINPDLEPIQIIKDKLLEFTLSDHSHRYSSGSGLAELKSAVGEFYRNKLGVDLQAANPGELSCLANGTQEALVSIFRNCRYANDQKPEQNQVLLGMPNYLQHEVAAIRTALPLNFFALSPDPQKTLSNISAALQANPAIRFLVLNFPNNPTGMSVGREFYQGLSEIAQQHDIVVVNDFIYGALSYEQSYATSALSSDQQKNFIEIFSLSKAYSVAGWRLATMQGDQQLIQRLVGLADRNGYGAFIPLQQTAAYILRSDQDYNHNTRETYAERVDKISAHAYQTLTIYRPTAGCCFCIGIQSEQSATAVAQELIQSAGVALQPEEVFGSLADFYGEGDGKVFLRCSLTADVSDIESALRALDKLAATL